MANPGIAPLDPSTSIGVMRRLIGDTEFIPLDPAVEGMGDYALFPDDQLDALLTLANGSLNGAIGYAYLKIAGQSAAEAVDWASDDLRLMLTKRPGELREIAQMWFDRMAVEVASQGDFFDIVYPFDNGNRQEELAEGVWPY